MHINIVAGLRVDMIKNYMDLNLNFLVILSQRQVDYCVILFESKSIKCMYCTCFFFIFKPQPPYEENPTGIPIRFLEFLQEQEITYMNIMQENYSCYILVHCYRNSSIKADFQTPVLARSSSQLAASTRTNVIPFPPHANLITHGMPVRRLGSDGKSSFCALLLRSRRKRRTKYLKRFWVRPIFQTRAQLSIK